MPRCWRTGRAGSTRVRSRHCAGASGSRSKIRTLLGALAARTDRVRLLPTVIVPPVMLAKALATGDLLPQCGPIIPGPIIPGPIMPRIIGGIPSRTKPVTSWACARMACVRAGSSEVSSAITPVGVRVNWRR
jgi:hypothetical protein